MHEKNRFQKTLILGLAMIFFAFACGKNAAESETERLKNDGQTLLQLNKINASLKAGRLPAEDFENLRRIREKYPKAEQVRQVYWDALLVRQDWQAIVELLTGDAGGELSREDKITLAKVYFKLGEYQKTIDTLAAMPEKDVEIKSLLGRSYFQIGQTDEAVATLEEISKEIIEQKRVDDLSVLGLVYFRQGNLPKAVETLNKAIEFDPDHVPSNNALSQVYARQGDRENAEKYRRKTSEIQKKITAETFENGRRVQKIYEIERAWEAKNYDEVIKLSNEALLLVADKNQKIVLYQYLFESHKAKGNEAEAENALADAKKLQQQK